ncbi:MAG TPA: glutamine--fructose-6-phosphate transaminase (isomerizing) [Candidatus Polarisedimenticolia bacterium]|jgi:glucosamine--fructose-6-phosphate aminotransferase (isomerizing)|nr:glutamine--fructose-6-phosphate transaminase (isomerizing) [Candidatus Polarisedimenticolia bacterium]
MCGIVGYVGNKPAVSVILQGLRRLEYRGYDSAGIAVAGNGHGMQIRRAAGKLHNLEAAVSLSPLDGSYGIGHTRWATHGRPSENNAHPHRDCTGRIVVVHNGIIENYTSLKTALREEGHEFATQTDTEVIAHLVEKYLAKKQVDGQCTLEYAVRKAIKQLRGVFALAIMSAEEPNKIIAARNGPPAVIGMGENEYFVASDVPAILYHTRDLFFLGDGELAIITMKGVEVSNFAGEPLAPEVQHITWDPVLAEKGGFRHFMHKEIFEQPRAVRDTFMGRISQDLDATILDEIEITATELRKVKKVQIAACGTSWHAGLAGKFMLERLAHLPVEVEYASEFRYRDPILGPDQLTILITQSGETADTIAAQREAKRKGCKTLAVCNVVGAMIAREAAGVIYTRAGPEIGVASTKAFTTQLTALFLLALHLGELRGTIDLRQEKILLQQLVQMPDKLESTLAGEAELEELAGEFERAHDFLFLARGIHYPIALEGALKLKEISYIHAEGYPAGEMKHGPNALIDQNLPVVVLATKDDSDPHSVLLYEKTMSNLREVKARDGQVIAVATEGDEAIRECADHVLYVPCTAELLAPMLEIIPLQLLAYHIAVRRNCDVDKPRNLAKSVTVE